MRGLVDKIEWRTLALIIGAHLAWLGAGLLWQSSFWVLSLIALAVIATFHGSLQHETIHGHPTRYGRFNELLGSVPLIGLFPYRRYRALHLKHHEDANLTDPYEDPESYFWPLSHYQAMRPFMRKLFQINNTFLGRLAIGPALSTWGFFRTESARFIAGEPGVRIAWLLHALGVVVVATIIVAIFGMPLWVYVLFVTYPALSLTSLRTYAEHQAAENIGARSAIVETNPALALLYLNNNLHIVHHASPQTPWYAIPDLYAERKTQYLAANENYLFNGYGEIARLFAVTVKQPVDHPLFHRENMTSPSE